MRKRSEEETFNVQPGSIDASDVDHLKKLAKRMKKEQDCQMSEALELVAHAHGFKSWNNVHRFAAKRPDSSQQINLNGIWGKIMFVEIKPSATMYETTNFAGATPNLVRTETRINLASADKIEFSSGYMTVDDRVPQINDWIITSEPKLTSRSFYREPELARIINQKCRAVRLMYRSEDGWDAVYYIFFDEGDYHRVKRSIDDLTAGKSKK
jgi:hypothetical protein